LRGARFGELVLAVTGGVFSGGALVDVVVSALHRNTPRPAQAGHPSQEGTVVYYDIWVIHYRSNSAFAQLLLTAGGIFILMAFVVINESLNNMIIRNRDHISIELSFQKALPNATDTNSAKSWAIVDSPKVENFLISTISFNALMDHKFKELV
jgi:hypothetical protein